MKAALIVLSERGLFLARCLANALPSDMFGHENCALLPGETPFASLVKVTEWLFAGYPRLIFFTPAGAAVRALSGLPRDKHLDPAVVQVDPAGRFVVSLLSGHEGGANELAFY
ncbi:MAG: cobalamin biosynthesis protein CbiG, partial [Desulfonatronovibrionaceae bacterium]